MATILLVEDNDDVREMMVLALQLGGGHTVWAAANGQQALAILDEGRRPSLILADLMMPIMNGWELRAALMKDPRLARIPVVVISAVSGEMAQVAAAGYLPKPVDIDRLLDVVGEYCGRSDPPSLTERAARPSQ
jgi:CheY-like chemotaxis protein